MAEWTLIDTEKWARYEHFRHFMDDAPCSIWLTDDIDVTDLHAACHGSGKSFYIYCDKRALLLRATLFHSFWF